MLLVVLALPTVVAGCGAFGGGGAGDYEFIEDPVFTMDISPPVTWTYFPPKTSDSSAIWFFIGQQNDSLHADQVADVNIQAAMTESLVTANIPLQGVEITNDYKSVQIENPNAMTQGNGPLYGKVEAGAVTQSAVGNTGSAFVWEPYYKTVKVSVKNVGNTKYVWNMVKNTFMQKMTLNYSARFVGDITVAKT